MNPVEVVPGVWRIPGMVNAYVVFEGDRALAVDMGLPADYERILALIRDVLGADRGPNAVLLTHGHADHLGAAERARSEAGATVYASEAEQTLLRRPLTGSPTERIPLRYLVHGAARRAGSVLVRGGALRVRRVREWTPLDHDRPLTHLPGAPRVIATPGHTRGHVSVALDGHDVLIAGDALVTTDPYTGATGPRLIARGATNDSEAANRSLARLEQEEARLLLPGHGEPLEGVAAAATQALRTPQA